jgi:hypothetical protein
MHGKVNAPRKKEKKEKKEQLATPASGLRQCMLAQW